MQSHHRRNFKPTLLAALLCLLSVPALRAVRIDDFESTVSSPWVFSNGPEYPGATGSFSLGRGQSGICGRLAFDLSGGGNYVSATRLLATPVATTAVQLWVLNPGGVRVQVRVNDSTGQTLQYSPSRPFQATKSNHWYPLTVGLGATTEHWNGANDGMLHGSITSFSIVAQPSLESAGTIDFQGVTLLPPRSTLVNPAAAAIAQPPVQDFFQSLGVEITHADATAAGLDLVQSLGFSHIRTEMFWADIETQAGVYDFSWYDQLVSELKTRGIQPHFILCYGNPVYTLAEWFQPPRTPVARLAFANFAQAAASRYAGQGVHFEVWNEPNIGAYWSPPSASEFSALCSLATAKLHAGDASAPVASGGLAGIDLRFLREMMADGGVNEADAIGLHPYRLGIPEQLADDLALVRARIAGSFRSDAPAVWSTEAGYSSAWYGAGNSAVNRTIQAKYVVRQMLTGLGLGLPVQIVFGLRDAGSDASNPEENFGIVDANYRSKPLTRALRTLWQSGQGHTFAGILASPQTATHIDKFVSPTDTLLVVWSEAPDPQTITFSASPERVVDYLGKPLTPIVDAQGRYSVTVSDAPVYVSFPVE